MVSPLPHSVGYIPTGDICPLRTYASVLKLVRSLKKEMTEATNNRAVTATYCGSDTADRVPNT